jgi:EamA domain-containing membrane protein RarD
MPRYFIAMILLGLTFLGSPLRAIQPRATVLAVAAVIVPQNWASRV